jgi:hypothetical protein
MKKYEAPGKFREMGGCGAGKGGTGGALGEKREGGKREHTNPAKSLLLLQSEQRTRIAVMDQARAGLDILQR